MSYSQRQNQIILIWLKTWNIYLIIKEYFIKTRWIFALLFYILFNLRFKRINFYFWNFLLLIFFKLLILLNLNLLNF
jgi:hypothetical protein